MLLVAWKMKRFFPTRKLPVNQRPRLETRTPSPLRVVATLSARPFSRGARGSQSPAEAGPKRDSARVACPLSAGDRNDCRLRRQTTQNCPNAPPREIRHDGIAKMVAVT